MTITPEFLEMPQWIYVTAVFIGALGGAIRAGEDEHTDLVGVLTLSAAMGFGGAIIRDVLLGNLPPASLRDPTFFIAAGAAAALGMGFLYYLRKLGNFLWWLDSVIIGLFACVGVNTALLAEVKVLPAVIIGTIASVGGLMLCDVLQGRPSSIMYLGPPNAIAGLGGAAVYAALASFTPAVVTVVIATAASVLVRLSGPVFHVTVPQPRKHAYELKVRRAFRRARKDGTLPEGLGDLAAHTGAFAAVTDAAHSASSLVDPEGDRESSADSGADADRDGALTGEGHAGSVDGAADPEPATETIYIDRYGPGLGAASAGEEWIASLDDDPDPPPASPTP